MAAAPYHVLFLCTGNSARSLMAECILRRVGDDRFAAHSAGSHPAGAPHPRALALLRSLDHDVSSLRSKGMHEFAEPDAPELHFVVTVCDAARGETCPVWPGGPLTTHWGVADPAAARGSDAEIERAFRRAYAELTARIEVFAGLPLDTLDRTALQDRLDAIGESAPDTGADTR